MLEHLSLDVCPPSLDPGDGATCVARQLISPVRAVPGSRANRPRPFVYATLGTARFNRTGTVWRRLVDAVEGLDVDVLVTVGRGNDPAALGDLPGNVRVEEWHDQADLMPECSAVICHGGSGTVLTALGYGVPVLAIPQGADQFRNADALERSGAGRACSHDDERPGVLRDALQALLDAGTYRAAAQRVAGEIYEMPAPGAAIAALETLVPA
jgi:MGT family glycosyltransferase